MVQVQVLPLQHQQQEEQMQVASAWLRTYLVVVGRIAKDTNICHTSCTRLVPFVGKKKQQHSMGQ